MNKVSVFRRVKTTSIGSLSEYMSDPESIFSLSNTDLSAGKPRRRQSQAFAIGHSRQTSLARSVTTTLGGKDKDAKGAKDSGEFQVRLKECSKIILFTYILYYTILTEI